MKLYVFQVNNGSMLTFDTELAVQTVLDLKHAIQAKYKIATQHQVLVVNGGECMVAERRVCSYSAGTDTNPIFLFNKEMILCDRAPTIPKTTFSIENEMEMKVEESLMMPAVFHTVASRTQLAVEMFEVAKKLCAFCERLVHDEHLQHQGWAAIMANLDDCTTSYQKLLSKFDMAYTNYQQDFEDIKLKLTKLGTAVSVMAKIPLLECLTRHSYRESLERSSSTNPKTEDEPGGEGARRSPQSANSSPTEVQQDQKSPSSGDSASPGQAESSSASGLQEALEEETEQEETEPTDAPSFNVTLLDWINVQDRPNDVEAVVRKCFDSINRLDPRIIQPFLLECRDTITKLDNQNMKAIKGLEDRLYALDQMIASCKKLVNEQKELAQGFLANQMRAENLKDNSVLPDLCLSHANQLMIMLTNHRKLLDIKQKCTTAKQELANNLQVRLKWCCYVMLHADQNGEKLQALLRLLTELLERVRVVEALSTVPQIYCLAVVEVVRRKMFIKHYREWAIALVKDGKNLYEAEKAKRETFGKLFRKSFLRNRLFRGLDSWPPSSFCTRKPRKFDFELPDISLTDLQYLKSCCPAEVQPFLRVPSLCDFEPLNHHTEALHQLVQAAQSVDEMSQTITDLLSELKVSGSQSPQRPSSEHRKETTTVSSKAPLALSIQSPPTQPLSLPAPLEDLSPDSIDAHTFDFETIGHPNMDPVLQQGSLDLDSLVESPESDFMSAVNEFVIEGNVTSPNPISDPTSPEMMVESLYSSVINAIDNKRIQDTTLLERENSRIMALKLTIDKYRSAAEESQGNMRKVKDDLCHFQGLVVKEQRDFGFALKKMSAEIHSIINNIRRCQEEELGEAHQNELRKLKDDHEKHILQLTDELEGNHKIVRDVQRAMLELEGLVERKEKELAQMEGERERLLLEIRSSHQQAVQELERNLSDRSKALQDALQSRDTLASQLEGLHQYVREVRRALMPPTKPLLHTGGGVGSRGAFEKKLLTAVELRESNESLNKQCPAQAPGAGYLVALQPPTESKTSPKSPIRLQAPMDLDGEIAASEKSPREATEKNRSDLESGDELNNSLTEQLQGRPDSPFYTNHQDFKISPSSPPPLPSSSPLTTHAEWETYRDPNGRHFYYNRTTQERRWKPPRLRDSLGKRNEKHVTAPTETEESCLKQNVKDMWDFTLPGHQMATTQILPCEKSGPLNVTKITENGKKVRKNWTSSWTILQGSQLIFAKSQAMATSWFGSHQSKPEFSVDLKGASVEWASKEKSSKKHVLEVKTHRGPELLIQSDSESVINEWFKAINEAINIHAWESDEAIEEDMPESPGLEKTEKENQDQQKKTKTRLKKFLIRRPSLQAVRDKGYIKDVVFGCNLISLCQREKTTVPHFVKMCIEYIENDGLNLDGLYRVSGNLAVIQKLRFAVNHDEKINLADSKWEDIHVATGALKMFFRELPDPLFTYLHFNDFFNAIKIPDYKQKVQAIKDIVKQLPQPNQDTMQALFSHLRKVIEHGEQNRMTTQSVAIVFGPTLLRPEIENMHTAVHMVYQNQIVELILYEYDSIFHM